jgi:hypothetical protein
MKKELILPIQHIVVQEKNSKIDNFPFLLGFAAVYNFLDRMELCRVVVSGWWVKIILSTTGFQGYQG